MSGFHASKAQRLKVAGQPCVICGQSPCDPAHIVPRSLGGCDHPDCCAPFCRQCHRLYDEGKLDALPYLGRREQAHAVEHLGIERARRRLTNQRAA